MARRRVAHEAELGDLGEDVDWSDDVSVPTSTGEQISEKTHHYVIGKGWVPNDERNLYQKLFNIPSLPGETSMAKRRKHGARGGGLRAWQEAHGIDTSGWDHPKRGRKKGKKSGRVSFVTSSGERVSFGAGKKRKKHGKKRHVRVAARRGAALWERRGWRKPGRKKGRKVHHRKAGRRVMKRSGKQPLWKINGWRKPGRKKHGAKRHVRKGHKKTHRMGTGGVPMWKANGWRKPGRKRHHKVGRKSSHKRRSTGGAYIVYKGKKLKVHVS